MPIVLYDGTWNKEQIVLLCVLYIYTIREYLRLSFPILFVHLTYILYIHHDFAGVHTSSYYYWCCLFVFVFLYIHAFHHHHHVLEASCARC